MLKPGDRAPEFSLDSDQGKTVRLADLRGKTVILYFYPKDDTPGCTREAQAFSAELDAFTDAGAVVLGVSRDSVDRHCRFRDKYDLRVTLLSDPEMVAHHAYSAFGEKLMYGKKVMGAIRSTFVIGADGLVKSVFYGVKVDGHAEKVLQLVRGEGAAEASPAPKPAKAATKASPGKPAAKAAEKPAGKARGSGR